MIAALFFIVGASLGSFVLVVVDRLYVKSFINDRSECFHCGHVLTWRELFPIVSYVLQRGKCVKCGTKYGVEHVLVEIVFGTLFTLLYFTHFAQAELTLITAGWCIYYTILFVVCGVLVLYDIRHKLIPRGFTLFFLLLSCVALVIRYMQTQESIDLYSPLVFSFPLLLIFLVTRGRGIGFGDVILFSGIGMLLGVSSGFLALLIAVWSATLVGLSYQLYSYIRYKKIDRKKALPFVPFIILGMLFVVCTGFDFVTMLEWFM